MRPARVGARPTAIYRTSNRVLSYLALTLGAPYWQHTACLKKRQLRIALILTLQGFNIE
jgi:hypothetical protein